MIRTSNRCLQTSVDNIHWAITWKLCWFCMLISKKCNNDVAVLKIFSRAGIHHLSCATADQTFWAKGQSKKMCWAVSGEVHPLEQHPFPCPILCARFLLEDPPAQILSLFTLWFFQRCWKNVFQSSSVLKVLHLWLKSSVVDMLGDFPLYHSFAAIMKLHATGFSLRRHPSLDLSVHLLGPLDVKNLRRKSWRGWESW